MYRELGLVHAQGPPLVRAGLLDRLVRASAGLPDGYDLLVLDGWRSVDLQREVREHYAEASGGDVGAYVADPDGVADPPHTTGGAVDLTLAWQGHGLALGTDYDDFSVRAHPHALEDGGPPSRDAALRRLLHQALTGVGLVVHPLEWWHWSYGDAVWAAATRRPTCYDTTRPPA